MILHTYYYVHDTTYYVLRMFFILQSSTKFNVEILKVFSETVIEHFQIRLVVRVQLLDHLQGHVLPELVLPPIPLFHA